MKSNRLLAIFWGILILSLSIPSFAAKNPYHVKASLVSEVESVQSGVPFWVGIHLEMEESWHTYWKNPGDSGGPTNVSWNLPQGLKASRIHWPYPVSIVQKPLTTYGYEKEVLLLVKITPENADVNMSQVELRGHVKWLECADVCIPGEAKLFLSLPFGSGPAKINEKTADLFSTYRSRLPLQNSEWIIQAQSFDRKYRLILQDPDGSLDHPGTISFFPSYPNIIGASANQIQGHDGDNVTLDLYRVENSTFIPASLTGVLVSKKGWRGDGSEKALIVDVPIETGHSSEMPSLLLIFLFAFLGGLLLNIMPCVLPILSLKVMSLIQLQENRDQRIFRHGLFYTLGVVVSFWVLAGILLILRAGGEHLGWGFQLQSPLFVIFMTLLFFCLSMNLFGLYEIGLSVVGFGDQMLEKGKSSSDHWNAFLTGVLATIVATPCTAPFMATALGVALSQTAVVSLLIFTALALGLASPYLFLSISPQFATLLPRPGNWMNAFRKFLGLLLMATVVWLLWVLSFQIQHHYLVRFGAVLILTLIGLGLWRMIQRGNFPQYKKYFLLGALLVLGLVLQQSYYVGMSRPMKGLSYGDRSPSENGIHWKKYSPEIVKEKWKQGDIVFVDFTAAWCLTCQVNDRVVFNRNSVISRFKELNVVALKADWTNKDPIITKALERLGRSGVPVYVLYHPRDLKKPRILPPLLTPQIVLNALSQ